MTALRNIRPADIPKISEIVLDVRAKPYILDLSPLSGELESQLVLGDTVMSGGVLDLDFIEELRLRRWARENYVPVPDREQTWHPIVHEEMVKKDKEGDISPVSYSHRWNQ